MFASYQIGIDAHSNYSTERSSPIHKGKLVTLFILSILAVATTLGLNMITPVAASEAPPIPSNSVWWDANDPSFKDRPSQPTAKTTRNSAHGTAAAATPTDPRFVCDSHPSVTLKDGEFLVNLGYFGSMDINPGTTGKTFDELHRAFGREYTFKSVSTGYKGAHFANYRFTGQLKVMGNNGTSFDTAIVRVKTCYMDFARKPWTYGELASSVWTATSATIDANPASTIEDGYRYIGSFQLVMRVKPATTTTTTAS